MSIYLGYVSHRNDDGSWMIQQFIQEIIDANTLEETEIRNIVTRVCYFKFSLNILLYKCFAKILRWGMSNGSLIK